MPSITERELAKLSEERIQLLEKTLKEKMENTPLERISGIKEFIKRVKRKGIKIAVATSTPKHLANLILQELDIIKYVDTIVGGDEVTNSKPNPEIFIKAAKAIGIIPQYCIVFEDAPLGIEAARRAGMKSIGLLTSHKQEEFSGNLMSINNFTELELV